MRPGEAPEFYLAHLKISIENGVDPLTTGKELYLILSWHMDGRVNVVEASKNTVDQLFSSSDARKWAIEKLTGITYLKQLGPCFMLTFSHTNNLVYKVKVREAMDCFLLKLITACSKYTNDSRPLLNGINAHELEYTVKESGLPSKDAESTQSKAENTLRRDRPAGPKMGEAPDRRGEHLNKNGRFFKTFMQDLIKTLSVLLSASRSHLSSGRITD